MSGDALLGSLIGVSGSILGGFLATSYNIWRQRVAETRREQKKTKIGAGIIYFDIFTLLKEMMFILKNKRSQGFISFSPNYSEHIASLGDNINENDNYCLSQLYGFLIKLQKSTMMDTLNSTEIQIHLSSVLESFSSAVYGNMSNFSNNVHNLNIDKLDYELSTRYMLPRFKECLDKINSLRG